MVVVGVGLVGRRGNGVSGPGWWTCLGWGGVEYSIWVGGQWRIERVAMGRETGRGMGRETGGMGLELSAWRYISVAMFVGQDESLVGRFTGWVLTVLRAVTGVVEDSLGWTGQGSGEGAVWLSSGCVVKNVRWENI